MEKTNRHSRQNGSQLTEGQREKEDIFSRIHKLKTILIEIAVLISLAATVDEVCAEKLIRLGESFYNFVHWLQNVW
jgi:uncharacterized protein YigA (DUF484 family)